MWRDVSLKLSFTLLKKQAESMIQPVFFHSKKNISDLGNTSNHLSEFLPLFSNAILLIVCLSAGTKVSRLEILVG